MSKRADEIYLPGSIFYNSSYYQWLEDERKDFYRNESHRFLKRITSKKRRKRKRK